MPKRNFATLLTVGIAMTGYGWSAEQIDLKSLPAQPGTEQICSVHELPDMLVPAGEPSRGENAVLATALRAYSTRDSVSDTSALAGFVADNPGSPWTISILRNLGTIYYSEGYFSKALNAWERGWELGKTCDDSQIKPVVDAVVGELAKMNARLGRVARLEELKEETRDRQVTGAATEMLTGAWEGLWLMKKHPEKAFLCGPLAVANISALSRPNGRPDPRMANAYCGPDGSTLTQVSNWAKGVGLDYQMAFREPGAPVIVPAVVNWRVGHFAALIKKVDGGYLMRDATFGGGELVVSKQALDAEASGYFLVPCGKLPEGWRTVAEGEGSKVFGKGTTTGTDPQITRKCDKKTTPCGGTPMAMAAGHLAAVSLNIADTPLYYDPPVGPPVRFTVTYNQRDAIQDLPFAYSNLGAKWTCDWTAYVKESGSDPSSSPQVFLLGGGAETYYYYSYTTSDYDVSYYSQTVLKRISDTRYERVYPDGSKEVYDKCTSSTPAAGRKLFLTQIVDAFGNSLTFGYDSSFRITTVTDAVGQVTTLSYELASDPLKITKVTDPFGRTAKFSYENGELVKITDMIGIQSKFHYSGDFIDSMTTPYGTSQFAFGESYDPNVERSRARWLTLTDPRGGQERIEYNELEQNVTGIPYSFPLNTLPTGLYISNGYMDSRNTFYWNKKAMATAPGDYSKARVFHWLHSYNAALAWISGSVLECEKAPLESRIWYNYPGQFAADYTSGHNQINEDAWFEGTMGVPSRIARKMDDGSTQLYEFEYNALGHPTRKMDPIGRETYYEYASNGVDLLAVYQKNPNGNFTYSYSHDGTNHTVTVDKIASFSGYGYDSQHLPRYFVDAAGQMTEYRYNTQGQILTRTVTRNSQQETTTWSYTNNYLMGITGPVTGATTSFTYDDHGRVRTVTDSEGYKLTYDYDNLDRVTRIAYPDGTFAQMIYDKLDPSWERDRMGRWTHYTHDALRHLHTVTDPKGQTTTYDWCVCGALDKIYDGNNNLTKFERDVQTRPTKKIYADNSEEVYTYEATTSRLHTLKDPKNWTRTYTYDLANSPLQVTYSHPSLSSPTQSYAYSPAYPRLTSAILGTNTTAFTYYPVTTSGTLGANQLWKVDGPLSGTTDELVYTYDELGRTLSAKINGTGETVTYDALGRVGTAVNPLGTFTYSYINQTPRVDTITRTGGQFTVDYGYLPNNQDQRLAQIKTMGPSSAVISKFDYTYDAQGDIKTWTQQQAGNPQIWTIGYDAARQLDNVLVKDSVSGNTVDIYSYDYDAAGNRKSRQKNGSVSSDNYNSLNQIGYTTSGSGKMIFEGTVSEPAIVTIAGVQAKVDANNVFRAKVSVGQGTNDLPIVAMDGSGNATLPDLKVRVTQPSGYPLGYTYDANGNLTGGTSQPGYEWDAENRLLAVNYSGTGNRTEFDYDGLGCRIKITEKTNNVVTSTKNLVWIGDSIAEERDASNAVARRFYGEGEQIGGTAYFYAKDHLGSIREMTDTSGAIRARYTYDPYGGRTKVSGDLDASFGFTGHYYHDRSGLHLAKYRAYDASLGRWISRDPLEQITGEMPELAVGLNLYSYTLNEPVNMWDLLGDSPNGMAGRSFIRAHSSNSAQCEVLTKQFNDLWDENHSYGYLGPVALIGTLFAAETAVTQSKNIKFDGPKLKTNPRYGVPTGRVCQVRWNNTPIFRLDYTTTPRSPNKPVLHGHVWPVTNIHIH